jgi:hypothetical protein
VDAAVLVVLEAELAVRLLGGRGGERAADGVERGALLRGERGGLVEGRVDVDAVGVEAGFDTQAASTPSSADVKKRSPSVPGPKIGSTACSGCGMRPTTVPEAFEMPAMSRYEPFGLTSR